MNSKQPPLCADCKWMTLATEGRAKTPLCTRYGGTLDVVTGGMSYQSCAYARSSSVANLVAVLTLFMAHHCGPKGRDFEPKPENPSLH